MMKCLLVEDEPLAMLRLKEYVGRVPFLSLVHVVDNGLEAIALLQHEPVDLIFLDVEMDGFSGLQLLETLTKRPAVILTTAFDQYALKAFDLQVTDYLLKPYTFERFMQAVVRAREGFVVPEKQADKAFIFVKTEYRLQKVNTEEILYIEGMRDYRRIHLESGKIMTLETFGELEQKLGSSLFCRVHKSFLVNLSKTESVERDRIKIGEVLIPVSDTYREHFYQLIGRSAKS